MKLRLFALGLAVVAAAGSGCARPQPDTREPIVQRTPSDSAPVYLRELVSGKTLYLNVPPEMRSIAIDYLRAAGAIILDRWPAELQMDSRVRSDTTAYPSGGYASASPTRTVIDLELSSLRKDGSRQLLLQGKGEATGRGAPAQVIELAGRRALVNLH